METAAIFGSRKERYIFAITAVIVALTRFAALSKTPWDWDEVLFCLALNDYNVAAHHPHPPGFPLFIALGRIVRVFADSDFHALQTINVIAGMLVFPVMYWVARAFRFDFQGALAAGIVFAFLPNVWFYGGTAFSDVPAMILFLAAIGACMSSGLSARRYYLGAILIAAGVLIRPQNAVVAVFPWTIATVRFVRAKRWGTFAGGSLLIVALVAIGYGAAMYATGVEAYISAFKAHSAYVKTADGLGASLRPPLWEVFLIQLDPFEAGKVSLLMNVLALAALIRGRRRPVAEVLLTFLPFFVFAMLSTNPLGSSRFSLNYVAGLVLLAVEGAALLGRLASNFHPRAELALRSAVAAVIVARMVTWVLPSFEEPRSNPSPPVEAAMWASRHVPLTDTLFVDESIWPWADYYAPKHKKVRPHDPINIILNPEAARGWFIGNGPTTASSAVLFRRPHTRLWNIVTKRSFESYVQPSASVVKFAAGWYAEEGDIANSWRWAKRRSLLLLAPTPGRGELRLSFAVPVEAVRKPVTVTFRMNGDLLETRTMTEREGEVRYVVPAHSDKPNLLNIEVSDSFVPARQGQPDHRELAFMLRSVVWNRL